MDTSDTTKSRESTEATIPTAANPTGMHPTVTHPGTVHPGTVHSSTVHPTSANPVFPTSFLVWTDAESGEELGLALSGPDELVRSLLDHGFELKAVSDGDAPRATARILADFFTG